MLNKMKIIWEWVKGACVIIVLLMILSGVVSGMYFGEYDKGLFYLAMYYVFFVQENGGIKVVIKGREKDGNHGNKIE
jgi:hypothetical protein